MRTTSPNLGILTFSSVVDDLSTNDIVSARHELVCKVKLLFEIFLSLANSQQQAGHIDNLVPLLVYHRELSPQEAVDEIARIVRESYDAFQALEPQLAKLGYLHGLPDEMDLFVQTCKSCCIGQFQWM